MFGLALHITWMLCPRRSTVGLGQSWPLPYQTFQYSHCDGCGGALTREANVVEQQIKLSKS